MVKNGLYISNCGTKRWYKDNIRHRLNGPAYHFSSGHKVWYQNDQLHRSDGHAIEYYNGCKVWYYQNQRIECDSQEEFERIIKLKILW